MKDWLEFSGCNCVKGPKPGSPREGDFLDPNGVWEGEADNVSMGQWSRRWGDSGVPRVAVVSVSELSVSIVREGDLATFRIFCPVFDDFLCFASRRFSQSSKQFLIMAMILSNVISELEDSGYRSHQGVSST